MMSLGHFFCAGLSKKSSTGASIPGLILLVLLRFRQVRFQPASAPYSVQLQDGLWMSVREPASVRESASLSRANGA